MLPGSRLGRDHGQAGVDLAGVEIDDRPAQGPGQSQGGRGLARAGSPDKADEGQVRHALAGPAGTGSTPLACNSPILASMRTWMDSGTRPSMSPPSRATSLTMVELM